jgi:hypothetical protein
MKSTRTRRIRALTGLAACAAFLIAAAPASPPGLSNVPDGVVQTNPGLVVTEDGVVTTQGLTWR